MDVQVSGPGAFVELGRGHVEAVPGGAALHERLRLAGRGAVARHQRQEGVGFGAVGGGGQTDVAVFGLCAQLEREHIRLQSSFDQIP